MPSEPIPIHFDHQPIAGSAGLFVSPGYGHHPDRVVREWELIVVRSSTLHIEENGIEYHVRPGESLLMPPLRRHRGLSEHSHDLSFYWIHFTLADRRLASPLKLPQHVQLSRPEWVMQLIHQFIADQVSGEQDPLAADTMMLLMLIETQLSRKVEDATSANAVVRKAEELISHWIHRGTSPGEVADRLGYSTNHLSRLFLKVHGVTLGGFIHRTQITQAKTLLHDSSSPLKLIANQCGFQDVGYFRRIFRRQTGISPSEYRNRFGRVRINRD